MSQAHVDGVSLVSEKYIALSVLRLLEMEKFVVEGGGATGLAAILPGGPLDIPALKGEYLLAVFSCPREATGGAQQRDKYRGVAGWHGSSHSSLFYVGPDVCGVELLRAFRYYKVSRTALKSSAGRPVSLTIVRAPK